MTITADTDPSKIIKLEQDTVDIIEETLDNDIKVNIDSQVAQIETELNYGLSQDAYIEDGASPFNEEAGNLVETANNLVSEFGAFKEKAKTYAKEQVQKELKDLESAIKEKLQKIENVINYAETSATNWNNLPIISRGLVTRTAYDYCKNYDEYISNREKYKSKLVSVQSQIKYMGW